MPAPITLKGYLFEPIKNIPCIVPEIHAPACKYASVLAGQNHFRCPVL